MKVDCPSCHKVYNIREELLKIGKETTFKCEDCNGIIKIDLRSNSKKDVPPRPSQTTINEKQKKSVPLKKYAEKQPRGQSLKSKILQILMGRLPVMPQIVVKAQEVMSDPSSSLKDLARVIETDQGIVTRTLVLANSAYYGLAGKVSSIQHASVLLGNKTLGEVIIMAGASGFLNKTLKGYGLDSKILWRHSLAVAFGSKFIARKKFPELENDALVAGLMHDAGKIMLDQHVFERKEAFEEFMRDGQETFLRAEKEILGLDHSEIGSEICKIWGIPESLTIAIRYHHYPSLSKDNWLAYIVHVANSIAMMSGIGSGIDDELYQIEVGAMEFLGLEKGDEDDIMSEVSESVKRIGEELGEA
ncbi:MAG: zinc-ribbon domain-containing protein [Deltaproteobacteria bacterium]|nr:zinc-ribbon domain-containing protein [Deltaproteobacteria bacterium]MBW1726571.1 zinc-ribbon domain-containing protein [Deltaproteobacteria bacterium]MBW2113865.1 zinc-ribbon domain-containing protein [Deltaproteobacteria bacterium]MBW2167913.1 zinc-ribbon domain-containing protein [Deltaproteobacteria bacterium]